MFVQRMFYQVRPGCTEELVQMILDEWKRLGFTGTYRVLTAEFGPKDQVCWEAEFADLAAYRKFWDDWSPPNRAWVDRWHELSEGGGTNEFWQLRE